MILLFTNLPSASRRRCILAAASNLGLPLYCTLAVINRNPSSAIPITRRCRHRPHPPPFRRLANDSIPIGPLPRSGSLQSIFSQPPWLRAFAIQQFEKGLETGCRPTHGGLTPHPRSEKSLYVGDFNIRHSQVEARQSVAKFGHHSKEPSSAFSRIALLD